MTQRYFVASLLASGGLTQLPSSEVQHAFRVMRLNEGDELMLFDGLGHEAPAKIIQISRNECICDALARQEISRESKVELHLAVSIPKGDRAKEMLMRLTELGVSEVTPIMASRTQRPFTENATEKLARIVIEASKQCGRNRLLRVNEPKPFAELVALPSIANENRWILHTRDCQNTEKLSAKANRVTALIGPEGGWSEHEVQVAHESGFQSLSLGARVLRIETAATAIAAIVCCDS